jgi:hypothetical protein
VVAGCVILCVVFGGGAGVARVGFGAQAGFLGFSLQHSSLLEFGPHLGSVTGGRYVVGGRVAAVVFGGAGLVVGFGSVNVILGVV